MVKSKKNNLHLEVSKSSKTSGSNMISSKRGAKKASSAIKKGAVSSKYGKRRVLQKIKLKIMPSLDDIKEFFGVKDKAQKKSSSAAAPAKKLMPSSSTNDTKNSVSKTIYMPIKQEANGQTAEAIVIVVEDKEEKADLDLQNVKLVVKAEKENEKIFWSMI